jgi:NAD(P)H dehydrogenase (quinone)
MVNMLVCYYSRSGHTKEMAEEIAKGAREAEAEVDIAFVDEVNVKSLADYDVIVMGSPTYYGTMAAPCKDLFDKSVKMHGKLKGKLGGAFASSGGRAGGNETTVLDILKAWLVHGMLVLGTSDPDHFGPVAVRKPDEKALKSCGDYGRRMAETARKLAP